MSDRIRAALAPLIGRMLVRARRAADMRMFLFSPSTDVESGDGSRDEFSLHVQCPWRLEGPDGIVTGRMDLWEPAEPNDDIDWDPCDDEKHPNLQDRRIEALLGADDPAPTSDVNRSVDLVVESVDADDFGGASVSFAGGYRLVIFPSGSVGEDWRLLSPRPTRRHFVVRGGRAHANADGQADPRRHS